MSIMHCDRHNVNYDTDFVEDCFKCENEEIEGALIIKRMDMTKTINNMKKNSGQLYMTKRERDNILLMLDHAERNIGYGFAGTYFADTDKEMKVRAKEIKKSEEAIRDIKWILQTAIITK